MTRSDKQSNPVIDSKSVRQTLGRRNQTEAAATCTDRLHFVGIGGSGMSGLARLAAQQGAMVTGSDHADSTLIESLREAGIGIVLEQTAASLPVEVDTVVISAAIPYDHPEVIEAKRREVEVIKYAQMLGRMMIGRTGVAVAGTHGKSSTTSMLGHGLTACGLDPSVIVGAHCPQLGGGARLGASEVLLAEACEYDRSFHQLRPTHGVILNVEADHLDIYDGIEAIVESFAEFARLLPEHGSLLIQHGSPHRLEIAAGLTCAVETIGYEPAADWRIEILDAERADADNRREARPRVRLREHGDVVAEWAAPMPGEHMAYNSAVAAVTARRLGAAWADIEVAIAGFEGLDRRMQRLKISGASADSTVSSSTDSSDGVSDNITIIDDYGHHPTEVDTTLRALRRHYRPERLICVFQPHQHSRTRFLLQQFATSFTSADLVVVPEIYFVRDSEEERQAVTSADLVDALRGRGTRAMHLYPFAAIVDHLSELARPGDLIVTMGAGNVNEIAYGVAERLGQATEAAKEST